MIKSQLLREERGGGGYLFSRDTGDVREVKSDEIQKLKNSAGVDFLELPHGAPKKARAAPFCVWFELTRQCNLQCPYCGAPPNKQIDSPLLNLNEISKVFDDFVKCGVFEVRFTGGEPTLHPKIFEIINEAAKKGLFLSVNSNGVWSDYLREKIISSPVRLYIISLDGPKQVHNALRPPKSYDSVVAIIKLLVEAQKKVRVNTVLTKKNRNCFPEFVAELEDLGVEALTLVPLRPAGRSRSKTFESMKLSSKEYGTVLKIIHTLRQNHRIEIAASYDLMSRGQIFNTPKYFTKRCIAGVEAACLSPTGDLRACILLDDEPYIVGNVVKESFSTLWNDDQRWGIFRDESKLSEQCKNCSFFSTHCPGSCQVIADYYDSPEIDPYCQLKNKRIS